MTSLSEIMSESVNASYNGTFKSIPQWTGLALVTLIITGCFSLLLGEEIGLPFPSIELGSVFGIVLLVVGILALIYYNGIFAKILRKENAYFNHFGRTFWEGAKFTIVEILYVLIPAIVCGLLFLGFTNGIDLLTTQEQEFIYYAGIIGAIIISVLIAIFFTLFWLPAMVAFAKTGKISKAFNFVTLDEMIQSISWKKFLCGYLVLIGILLIMTAVLLAFSYALTFIPFAGVVLAVLLFSIFFPYIWIYSGYFVAKLFEVNANE